MDSCASLVIQATTIAAVRLERKQRIVGSSLYLLAESLPWVACSELTFGKAIFGISPSGMIIVTYCLQAGYVCLF
jgi:hypothetical protein